MKIVSLNVEFDKHHDVILPFLKKEDPDVVCLQELLEADFEMFKKELGMSGTYKPIEYIWFPHYGGPQDIRQGAAIFAKNFIEAGYEYYVGSEENINHNFKDYFADESLHKNNVLLVAKVADKNGVEFTIATTHFTLTQNGESTPLQLENLDKLFALLSNFPEIVFVGDMNAPRGFETFTRLSKKYKDNIPAEYKTSIDVTIHRNGMNCAERMVDGLFTTPDYTASNVKLVNGLSDHMAIVADVEHTK